MLFHPPLRWLSLCLLALRLEAAEPVITDPAKVDADYALQGEYAGEIGGQPFGAQVIAMGGGQFTGLAYQGGLPGLGWDGARDAVRRGEARAVEGKLTFEHDGMSVVAHAGEITIQQYGSPLGKLQRLERTSPTLGEKAPAGAIQLFAEGQPTEHWAKAEVDDHGLLKGGATTKEKWQNFKLHVEFRTPYQPTARGQGRGNSGVYMQARYEVQVLDSFGLKGENNECGGIYGIAAPKVNLCLPPLQWQTYDIDFTAAAFDEGGRKVKNARLTVRHNGVVIHENAEADRATTAAPLPEGPAPGPLYLQDHGNPVRYRNVWLLPQ